MSRLIAVYTALLSALLSALLIALFAGSAAANSRYFFEGIYSGGRGDIAIDDTEVTFERESLDLTVNFGWVNTDNAPFNEAAFLNRSSFVQFRQTRLDNGDTEEPVINEAQARFVLASGLYLAAAGDVATEEHADNRYEFQLGQFTSNHTSVFIGYVVDDADSADVYTAG